MENNSNSPECQPGHWITPITMTIFMIVACLLFLSILIASFKYYLFIMKNLAKYFNLFK